MTKVAKKGVVLSLAFGLLIWASSKTVITVDQLTNIACSVLPLERDTFKRIWEEVWWVFVKGWHAMEFGILNWLVSWALSKWKNGPWIAVLITVTCAFADEIHQTSVAARGGRLSDVVIDCIGIACSAFLISQSRKNLRLPPLTVVLGLLVTFGAIGLLALYPFGDLSR